MPSIDRVELIKGQHSLVTGEFSQPLGTGWNSDNSHIVLTQCLPAPTIDETAEVRSAGQVRRTGRRLPTGKKSAVAAYAVSFAPPSARHRRLLIRPDILPGGPARGEENASYLWDNESQSHAVTRKTSLFHQILGVGQFPVVEMHVPLRGRNMGVPEQPAGEFDSLRPGRSSSHSRAGLPMSFGEWLREITTMSSSRSVETRFVRALPTVAPSHSAASFAWISFTMIGDWAWQAISPTDSVPQMALGRRYRISRSEITTLREHPRRRLRPSRRWLSICENLRRANATRRGRW